MSKTLPSAAIVRPRVILRPDEGPRLLEDVVDELADELPPGLVWVVGGPGSGKSTAIAHLAAIFADDARLAFFDEPTGEELDCAGESALVLAAAYAPASRSGLVLRLVPWQIDDLVEYLLASQHEQCTSVMKRLGHAANESWTPELACLVLNRFAQDEALADPIAAIMTEVRSRLPKPRDFATAGEYCFAVITSDLQFLREAQSELEKRDSQQNAFKLLRHSTVQLALAAERIVSAIVRDVAPRHLDRPLPVELLLKVGCQCRDSNLAIQRLRDLVRLATKRSAQPMAASILSIADPQWRPTSSSGEQCFLSGGWFQGVNWPGVELARAELRMANFTSANLPDANFEASDAHATCFLFAQLQNTRFIDVRASHADFCNADLTEAKLSLAELAHAKFVGANLSSAVLVKSDLSAADLTEANCSKADLCGARLLGAALGDCDFTSAKLDGAYLHHCDLRTAALEGACFHGAFMAHAQLEDVLVPSAQFRAAHLQYAHLTGSRLPAADFRGATLAFAHLAEIDWPAADLRDVDLRGVSFHMGSSRSGLVGSPIACEGSKTGFYTDDREEMYFKRPEEIRKANLRGADLRGARIDKVDFYLVDLREAQLDPTQIAQLRKTGAILEDPDI